MKSRKYSAVVSLILVCITTLIGAILCPDKYRCVVFFILAILYMLNGIIIKLNDLIEEIQNLQENIKDE